jgi:ATP phosphoribosyltransferase
LLFRNFDLTITTYFFYIFLLQINTIKSQTSLTTVDIISVTNTSSQNKLNSYKSLINLQSCIIQKKLKFDSEKQVNAKLFIQWIEFIIKKNEYFMII